MTSDASKAEAEAREAVERTYAFSDGGCVGQRWGYHEEGCGCAEAQQEALDAFEAAIRADQSAAVSALVEAARAAVDELETIASNFQDGRETYVSDSRLEVLRAALIPFPPTEEPTDD